MSRVSWFHKFRGVNGFIVSYDSWFRSIRGFNGFMDS